MKAILTFLACVFASALFSQSNINQTLSVNSSGAAADASAQLDVSATDKGMLVPRMTTAQRTAIASPATGLLVFDMTTGGFWFYNGTAWTNLSAPKTLADADGNTKVQVEESPNEDIIRFDLAGTENMVLRKNASGIPRLELTHLLNNTFVGLNAGQANTTGANNSAYGKDGWDGDVSLIPSLLSLPEHPDSTNHRRPASAPESHRKCGGTIPRQKEIEERNRTSGARASYSSSSSIVT